MATFETAFGQTYNQLFNEAVEIDKFIEPKKASEESEPPKMLTLQTQQSEEPP